MSSHRRISLSLFHVTAKEIVQQNGANVIKLMKRVLTFAVVVNSDMALPENVLDENDEEDLENDFDFETVNVLPEDDEEDAENDLDLEV